MAREDRPWESCDFDDCWPGHLPTVRMNRGLWHMTAIGSFHDCVNILTVDPLSRVVREVEHIDLGSCWHYV